MQFIAFIKQCEESLEKGSFSKAKWPEHTALHNTGWTGLDLLSPPNLLVRPPISQKFFTRKKGQTPATGNFEFIKQYLIRLVQPSITAHNTHS